MKKQYFLVLFFTLVSLALSAGVRVELMSRADQQAAAQKLGKIVFEGSKMQVVDMEGNIILESELEDEPVITVDVDESVVEITDNTGEEYSIDFEAAVDNTALVVSVSPNPMKDVVCVRGAEKGSSVRIYSLGGELVREAQAGTGAVTLNVQPLAAGVYIMRVNNNLVKLIKQ